MKRGFTLSELMIAMAVLGILLALVIPIIANTRPDEFKMLTKKAYFVTEQIVSSLINDPQLYPDSTMYCTDEESGGTCYYGFDDVSSVAYNGHTANEYIYWEEAKFPRLFAEQLNVAEGYDSEDVTKDYDFPSSNSSSITTTDGIKFEFNYDSSSSYDSDAEAPGPGIISGCWANSNSPTKKCTLLIDVNGDSDPNCLETDDDCTHPDQFRIEIQTNGRMHVYEGDTTAASYIKFDTAVFDN